MNTRCSGSAGPPLRPIARRTPYPKAATLTRGPPKAEETVEDSAEALAVTSWTSAAIESTRASWGVGGADGRRGVGEERDGLLGDVGDQLGGRLQRLGQADQDQGDEGHQDRPEDGHEDPGHLSTGHCTAPLLVVAGHHSWSHT
ncbi:hypothetical protein GCM10020221_12440 [Streptomyces thioluteus]|uniref:Uncharacterized protein n=1 Tax=Streptomyces thioluteus TaxID=66431 RepID=A0ABN3WJF3_STRTU